MRGIVSENNDIYVWPAYSRITHNQVLANLGYKKQHINFYILEIADNSKFNKILVVDKQGSHKLEKIKELVELATKSTLSNYLTENSEFYYFLKGYLLTKIEK